MTEISFELIPLFSRKYFLCNEILNEIIQINHRSDAQFNTAHVKDATLFSHVSMRINYPNDLID